MNFESCKLPDLPTLGAGERSLVLLASTTNQGRAACTKAIDVIDALTERLRLFEAAGAAPLYHYQQRVTDLVASLETATATNEAQAARVRELAYELAVAIKLREGALDAQGEAEKKFFALRESGRQVCLTWPYGRGNVDQFKSALEQLRKLVA